MNEVPDAWEDEWSRVADEPVQPSNAEIPKKASSKVTKAQKRAQQAEFNRQLWAEAEGPKQTNFFLESRNVVPLRQEYKAPPVLLSRKGPKTQKSRSLVQGLGGLEIKDESSEDEDDAGAKQLSLAERQAQAAREREEKLRKYDERRLELFGPQHNTQPNSRSGNSSPGSGTPPQSRSSTPSRGGKRGRGRGNYTGNSQTRMPQNAPTKDLYDANYVPKPDSAFIQRRDQQISAYRSDDIQPIRSPRGPDGTAGFNFASRSKHINPDPAMAN